MADVAPRCYAVRATGPSGPSRAAFASLEDALDAVAAAAGVGPGPGDADERAYLRRRLREDPAWDFDADGPTSLRGDLDGVAFEVRRIACTELNTDIPPLPPE